MYHYITLSLRRPWIIKVNVAINLYVWYKCFPITCTKKQNQSKISLIKTKYWSDSIQQKINSTYNKTIQFFLFRSLSSQPISQWKPSWEKQIFKTLLVWINSNDIKEVIHPVWFPRPTKFYIQWRCLLSYLNGFR